MRNIIPQNLSASGNEVMSPELKKQFLELQRLQHRETVAQLPLHHNSPVGSGTCLSSLYDDQNVYLAYEEKNKAAFISRNSSEADKMDLVVSTAMRAQHEIDALMRSIAELEKMVEYNSESRSSHVEDMNDRSLMKGVDALTQTASFANIVEEGEFD